jgi:hypothetical protein
VDGARVAELAGHADWRARVEALRLPEREAYELRVAVLRARVFGAVEQSAARGQQRRRAS